MILLKYTYYSGQVTMMFSMNNQSNDVENSKKPLDSNCLSCLAHVFEQIHVIFDTFDLFISYIRKDPVNVHAFEHMLQAEISDN